MAITQAQWRDANGVPLVNSFDGLIASVTRTYTGAAGLGAQGATTLFTVTGAVFARTIGYCTVDLASTTGTIESGVVGNTAVLIAQTTASGIDVGEFWVDAGPSASETLSVNPKCITSSIIETIATADITAGTLTMYCLWRPLSSDGNVVAAL